MTKHSFLSALHKKLSDLPQAEVEERLGFYSEMIEDRMEEGLSEEEAVAAVGSVEEIAAQIATDIPLKKEKNQPKKERKAWKTVLLIAGSPIWGALLIAAAAVVFALYISLWAVVVALWAAFGAACGCTFGGLAASVVFFCSGNASAGAAMLGAGLVCGGLAIFLLYGCKAVTKGALCLGKKLCLWIKKCFSKREEKQ